ncbi:hypothetical protein C8R45DRAFT_1174536 [Mycena sanguinolenta]|nr:hypothetical protein C8R45DRAFT_1174536 [Mycena sanguinolenta]
MSSVLILEVLCRQLMILFTTTFNWWSAVNFASTVVGDCPYLGYHQLSTASTSHKAVKSASTASCLLPSLSMDLRPHSDLECSSVVSMTNSATGHPGVVFTQPSGFISNVLVKSMNFLPSLFGGPRVSSQLAEGNRSRSNLETGARFTNADQLVTNNYYISGGVGGAGGVNRDQGIGGGGGAGHGPTLNFYAPPREEQSGRQTEFRTIRLGDIKLRKEIYSERRYDIVDAQNQLSRGAAVRRVYSGEIRGDPGLITVAMYEGDWAEEEWRQDLAKYVAIRHPYITQLYGSVNTGRLRAMVFHDGADH